jgi:hypothetical protein
MAMNPKIDATIELIDLRIATLTRLREDLLNEFSNYGEDEGGRGLQLKQTRSEGGKFGLSSKSKDGRRGELRDYLAQHGVSQRKDIIKATKIPAGTFAFLVTKHKDEFQKIGRGRWKLKLRALPQNTEETKIAATQ